MTRFSMDDQEIERFVRKEIEDYQAAMPDAVFGMMSPAFVRCSAEERSLTVCIRTKPWMRNGNGVTHGGAIATMLDGMGGLLARCVSSTGWIAPTISFQVSYLKPVPIDADVHVTITATHAGVRIIQLLSTLTDPSGGTLYATGSGTQFTK